ncbi:phosphatidylinositol-glycan-specific phospholipase D isoform X2 [Pseudonaja textilis]|uniref:phosphatidylinositol-glycan-specific phospholipase D isoform X2 n=1 Tax=Pseudonaja textilis TaxID=8673 RepID=UPI000EAA0786|nr:phosphatidylinositol-glycan-specific phospholipase D isoform X2 [Pseudonaja textilis]
METSRIWLMLTVLCNFCERIMPCGLSTHIEIAHRGMEFFSQQVGQVDYRKLILAHQDAFQAGSLYPDAFYSGICQNGIYHYVSEDTHWSPFLNTSIHYIRKNYPQPWEEIDFHGSYSQAHSTGDFGGDVLSQYELDFDYLKASWYVPVKDLLSIYEDYYGKEVITENTIVDCTYLQLLDLYAEIIAASKLYPIYANKSPFLLDKFYDYFVGGVDDMAFASNNIFQLTSWILNYGTSGCFIPENPLFIRCEGEQRNFPMFKESRTQHHRKLTSDVAKSIEKNISYTERGVYLKVPHWTKNYLQFQNSDIGASLMNVLGVPQRRSSKYITKPSASYFLKTPYAKLGSAMTSADLNQDGYDDLVVGAPGYSRLGHIQFGRVYIVYGNESGLPHSNLDLDQEADEILEGTKPSGRFGSAIAILDFNVDGILDLAVGAPSVGAQELSYRGSVYIFLGNRGGGFHSLPNITIICQEIYCNLGWSLLTADVDRDGDNDLVLGSPYAPSGGKQRGFVASFYSSSYRNRQRLLFVADADWMVKGETDYGWFGSSLSSVQLLNKTLLLIGSPFGRNCTSLGCYFSQYNKQAVGKVYGYIPPNTKSWFTLSGDDENGRFGSALATGFLSIEGISKQVLIVGAPTQGTVSRISFISSALQQAGSVLIYDLMGNGTPALLSTFNGDRRFSRFGEEVHLRDLNNDGLDEMIVSSPLRNQKIMGGLFGEQLGYIYIYSGNQTTSGHVTDHCKSWISPCPEDWAQYVIISPEGKSRFGSTLLTMKTGEKSEVVVAAERSSTKARLSGRLFLYTF